MKINKYVTITDKDGKKHKCDIEMLMLPPRPSNDNWAWYLGNNTVKTILFSKKDSGFIWKGYK